MKRVRALPLAGVRVTDLTKAWAGPVCTMILADMGAEIIKVENPAQPEPSRIHPPFADNKEGPERGGYFNFFNRGKQGIMLDLKQPEDIATLKRLVKISDLVIENFAPRTMASLGLDYSVLKEIKPDIIMISLSGYGANGPDKDTLAYGPTLEAYSGLSLLMGSPGDPPHQCGPQISDHSSAISGALAALFALHHRDLTGEGQHIDISEVETLLACMPEAIMEFTMNGRIPPRPGNKDEVMAPHGCYRCQGEDKWLAIAIDSDEEWQNLCRAIGRPELITDERFQDGFRRRQNQDELDQIIAQWASRQTATEVMAKLQKLDIAAAPVYSGEEIYQDPHLRARGFFVEIDHPEIGKRELPGLLAKLSQTPGSVRRHAPLLNEHADWIRHKLLSTEDSR